MLGAVDATDRLGPLCVQCGYDLRGLPHEGRCPECGASIEAARVERTLSNADPRWLWRLNVAAWLVPAGILSVAAFETSRELLGSGWRLSPWMEAGANLATLALLLSGAVLASLPPAPPRFDVAPWRRRAVLAGAGLCLAVQIVGSCIIASGGTSSFGVPIWFWWLGTMKIFVLGLSAGLAMSHAGAVASLLPRSLLRPFFHAAATLVLAGFALMTASYVLWLLGYESFLDPSVFSSATRIAGAWMSLASLLLVMGVCVFAARRLRAVRRLAVDNQRYTSAAG